MDPDPAGSGTFAQNNRSGNPDPALNPDPRKDRALDIKTCKFFEYFILLIAASALLVQNRAYRSVLIQVGVRFANCNDACGWPAVSRLVLAVATVPYYANQSLQFTSSRQVISTTLAAPQRKLVSSILPLKCRQFTRTKAYRRPV